MKLFPCLLLFLCLINAAFGQLQSGFYSNSCPQAESIIRSAVERNFGSDPSVAAALIRMHFHDCFVTGCDASILIDEQPGFPSPEKNAAPNLSVTGYNVIDEAKSVLESQCPQTVSCADIIAVATRDAVSLSGGPTYDLPTGRLDGRVSDASAASGLPGSEQPVADVLQNFADKGFSARDVVALLGAHTVGNTHCNFIKNRLGSDTNDPDSTMNPDLLARLSQTCQAGDSQPLQLDLNTPLTFDNAYFNQILSNEGVLKIDQEIGLDGSTSSIVADMASDNNLFNQAFVDAIVKMGSTDVLTDGNGEIRVNCRSVN